MTSLFTPKAEKKITKLCAEFKLRYPHLYGTSGERYVRKIIRSLFEYSGHTETFVARQG